MLQPNHEYLVVLSSGAGPQLEEMLEALGHSGGDNENLAPTRASVVAMSEIAFSKTAFSMLMSGS